MNRAVDPFEEFLRKKKAAKLEELVRHDGEDLRDTVVPRDESSEDEWTPLDQHVDPLADQRLKAEMNEFFERSADAGAELFAQARVIDEDRVDEIQDALEDVFDVESNEPEVVSAEDDTFIDFFKQVQSSFDPDLASLRREQELAREIVQEPPEGAFEDEPLTAEFPVPELPARAGQSADSADEFELEPEPMPIETHQPFTHDPFQLDVAMHEDPDSREPAMLLPFEDDESDYEPTSADLLNLSEILGRPLDGEDMRQRVEVLSRLVVKLVERSRLPESEIIEVLIKSGVGF